MTTKTTNIGAGTDNTQTGDAEQMTSAELATYYDFSHDLSEFDGGEVVAPSETAPQTRSVTISVRFSPSELAELEQLAIAADMRVTAYIRDAALAAEEVPVDRAEVLDLVEALRRSVQGTRQAPGRRSGRASGRTSTTRSESKAGNVVYRSERSAARKASAATKAAASKAAAGKAPAAKTTQTKATAAKKASAAKTTATKTTATKTTAAKTTATKTTTAKKAPAAKTTAAKKSVAVKKGAAKTVVK